MGIHFSSIAQINSTSPETKGIKYFVYLINYYDIDGAVVERLLTSIPSMDEKLSKLGNAVSVSSVKNIDFANDALSWSNCFGVDAEEVCPAILVCTLPPQYFIPHIIRRKAGHVDDDTDVPWLLLSLKDRGRDFDDLREIIMRVVEETSLGIDISNFSKARILRTKDDRPVLNGEASSSENKISAREVFRRIDSA